MSQVQDKMLRTNVNFEVIYQQKDNDTLFLFAKESNESYRYSLFRLDLIDHPEGELVCPKKVNHRFYHRQFLESNQYLKKGDINGFFSEEGARNGETLDVDSVDVVMGCLTDSDDLENVIMLFGAAYFYGKMENLKNKKRN